MKKRVKRSIAALISFSLLCTSLIVPNAEISALSITKISFDSENDTSYTVQSGASLADGRDNKALSLVGTDTSYATVDAAEINSLTGDFSISVWCYPNDDNMWTRIYDIGTGTDKYMFLAPSSSWAKGYPRFVLKPTADSAEQVLAGEEKLNIDEWNNITVVRKDGLTSMYLNGMLIGKTDAITANPSDMGITTNNYLGKSQYAPDPYFNGMIDDFTVYDSALTVSEVQEVAAEAYKKEVVKLTAKQDRYIITNNFYNQNSEKIFQIDSGVTELTSKINIENKMTIDGCINVKMYSVKADKETEIAASEKNIELKTADKIQLELKANIPSDFDYIKVVATDKDSGQSFEIGRIALSDMVFPDPSGVYDNPDADPKYGAHDPSIFKDPKSGKYYAYSSHNQIFESDDLINWTKHNYKGTITVPKTTSDFIANSGAYADTSANGTYWAPDVIYVEGEEYPYWCYVSVSCGLGGRNSVISLLKCKSPGIWDDKYIDCGVVIASVENDNYKTNAIDANIYTDTDGKRYFVWGSFWQGIFTAPLNDDGTIAGIDCFATGAADDSNNAVMIEKSKNFGNPIMSVKNGVVGPEGPWLISNTESGYRYLFTSYGWLGTNYNIRLSRSDINTSMSDFIKSGSQDAFVDENGNKVGKAYTDGSDTANWGYKLIGSYKLGDGITYYGNGHNSVLNDDGEWYLVDHVRKVADATAYLQVRKMLWTDSGWPVVSPLGYTGEIIQDIDETMIYGTWDLASVGQTLTGNGTITYKESDLPVESSEIVLMPDGKLADDLGTWTFDGEHTVQITFAQDGNIFKNQYYKSGDVMTMYVLTGYDSDKAEYAVVMTGIDQNTVTQFAKKSNASTADTRPYARQTTAKELKKSVGGNPILGFDTDGNRMYAGDPAATVIGDTVYLYAGHDISDGDSYVMNEWVLYTSKDMINWEYKGPVMKATDVSWRNDDTSAWASQVAEYNGKYYLYFCTWDKTDGGKQSIGVAVADSPEGPFVDKGTPLVKGSQTYPETSGWNDIDPTVWIETDENGTEHRYLAWGNGRYYICELNEDMISVTDKNSDGKIDMNDIKLQKIKNMGNNGFTEAPWLYKRGDKYYTFFAANWREEMAYAVSSSIYGPWEYMGQLMPPTATSNTNHPSVIDFKGKTYFIYHNGALPNGSGFRRSVCVEELFFDEDGNVLPITETSIGIGGTPQVISTLDGKFIAHNEFTNPSSDNQYPISEKLIVTDSEDGYNTAWEIVQGKTDSDNPEYVSIQSVNKPGLYIAEVNGEIVLTADDDTMAKQMTFRTVEGADSDSVSFESLTEKGKYLTVLNGTLILSYGRDINSISFKLDNIGSIEKPSALPKPTPTPIPDIPSDIENNFDALSVGTLISIATTDQDPIKTVDGVTLYIGTRGSGADSKSNFAIESSNMTGNALVLNSGDFVSASRGPRIQINTPVLSDGMSASAEFKVKLSNNGQLRYNDSTSAESGTVMSGLSDTEWTKISIEIKRDNGVYTRRMWIGGKLTVTDNNSQFPVFWGTTSNKTYAKVYFDDLSIKVQVNVDCEVMKISSNKIWIYSDSENTKAYAVKYDEKNMLEKIECFDLAIGENKFETKFEPDRIFVWTDNFNPCDMWKK